MDMNGYHLFLKLNHVGKKEIVAVQNVGKEFMDIKNKVFLLKVTKNSLKNIGTTPKITS